MPPTILIAEDYDDNRELLRLRRSEPALRPAAAAVRVRHDDAAGWVGVRYDKEGTVLEAVFNISADATAVPLEPGAWALAFASDAAAYGGCGQAALDGTRLRLPGHTGVLLRRTGA